MPPPSFSDDDWVMGNFITHEVVAFDSDKMAVAHAEAGDRQSAELAASTLITDDENVVSSVIRRTRDGQAVGWHTRTDDGGIRRMSIFKD